MTIALKDESDAEYVTFTVGGQLFGVPARRVQAVLLPESLTELPLAADAIAGLMNLRGHIVVVFDVRRQLGLAPRADGKSSMCIVVESATEQVALLVDAVGDVLKIDPQKVGPNPASLSPEWATICRGIYWLPNKLLLRVDIDSLIGVRTQMIA